MPAKPSPYFLMDPERSLRAFVAGGPATVPPWWMETDEDVTARKVASQSGKALSPQIPLLVDMLWDATSLASGDEQSRPEDVQEEEENSPVQEEESHPSRIAREARD